MAATTSRRSCWRELADDGTTVAAIPRRGYKTRTAFLKELVLVCIIPMAAIGFGMICYMVRYGYDMALSSFFA